ncbi:Gfo/Idh/MocA family oxidoreductase [candidate division KSB1 bacterium]|nr:Gfo/Idh/MocA family oxidoreductase [candidate division KSB1 bacterium]
MRILVIALFFILLFSLNHGNAEETVRIGLIGLDTSHAPAFARILNDTSYEHHLPGARIVAAFAGGSPDIEASAPRVERFTAQVADYGVAIVPDIGQLVTQVDAVILTSVDGRVHLEQVVPVLAAGLPVFIDKPMAASLADVKEIFRLADEAGVPCFSASSLRFFPELQCAIRDTSLGRIIGCDVYSPAELEPHHPDLMWYGIHGVEMLFAVMGADCSTLCRAHTAGTDLVTGIWADGRIGTLRGMRDGKGGYGATLFFEKGVQKVEPDGGTLYVHLMKEILHFFRTGLSPVPPQETIAMFAFMEAADVSKKQNGAPVPVQP